MYEVHAHPILQRYKAHVCSGATIFNIATLALTYILPLLVAYFSQGFWLKESTYREQAEIHFKHQMLIIAHGADANTLITYSTFQNYNNLMSSHIRIPLIQSYEVDHNRDGKNDRLNFEIQLPIKGTESIHSIQILFFFDYKLHRFASVQMESMAYVHYNSPLAGAEFYTEGDLKLKQKYPLPHNSAYTLYNVPIVKSSSIHIEDYQLSSIFSSYQSRNISTDYVSNYPAWKVGRNAESQFLVKGIIHYPEETIIYRPGFWQLIKVAWVQYLAVLFIFLFVFGAIRRLIFENQIILTVPQKVSVRTFQS